MSQYNLEARYVIQHDLNTLDDNLVDRLWDLFLEIWKFGGNSGVPDFMKSNFLVFLSNRIQVDYNYLGDYASAIDVINELVGELGREAGFEELFTSPAANSSPPVTKLARARQRVSNEFVALQLALGGFRQFGSDKNYPGYICGPNLPGNPPYRV